MLSTLAASTAAAGFHVGLLATAYGFGFRHGIDWDHLAALTDITSSQDAPRRSMMLATLYAVGHGLVVFVLGLAAILLSAQLPESVGPVMERVVGATLIVLGVYVVFALVRHGREFRMRSRWMLVISGLRHLRPRPRQLEPMVIEHEHEHALDEAHGHTHAQAHVHAGAPADHAFHRHPHRHVGQLPDDPFMTYGRPTAFFIGMLHGVGAETPTQVLIFLTAAGVGGKGAGIALLAVFLLGLLSSNTIVALAGTFGFLGSTRNWPLYVTVSLVTAAGSLVIGSLFLFGHGNFLPAIFSG
jgi:high-affinity nickel-transport protein